ncbi:hypothetical protein ABZ946_32350 [Streptomyces sp. NPDC046324]|uniref:hypothetical protein n=1 Tax=Streptomyces sp. NPDC046324 TaxID=3154915 RepID=UPI0033CC386F
MEEARLSPREQRVLAEIEETLGEDAPLERGFRTMGAEPAGHRARKRPGPGPGGRREAMAVTVLGGLALVLLVLAVVTAEPALIWAFAAVWVITLSGLLRLVVRWSRRLKPRSWPP